MRFRIHFEHSDGSEDSIIVSGDTLEEVRVAAKEAVEARNATYAWSEDLGSTGEKSQ